MPVSVIKSLKFGISAVAYIAYATERMSSKTYGRKAKYYKDVISNRIITSRGKTANGSSCDDGYKFSQSGLANDSISLSSCLGIVMLLRERRGSKYTCV